MLNPLQMFAYQENEELIKRRAYLKAKQEERQYNQMIYGSTT